MEKDAKEALQVTKEIVVKFIEANKISPTTFHQAFPSIYATVYSTITNPTPTNYKDNDEETPEHGRY